MRRTPLSAFIPPRDGTSTYNERVWEESFAVRVVRKKNLLTYLKLLAAKKEIAMHPLLCVCRVLLGHSQLPLPPEESQTIFAKCLEGWHGTDVAVKV